MDDAFAMMNFGWHALYIIRIDDDTVVNPVLVPFTPDDMFLLESQHLLGIGLGGVFVLDLR